MQAWIFQAFLTTAQSVYDTKFFTSLFERAFKMTKKGVILL